MLINGSDDRKYTPLLFVCNSAALHTTSKQKSRVELHISTGYKFTSAPSNSTPHTICTQCSNMFSTLRKVGLSKHDGL